MKKLILIVLLIFSSPSYAEWTEINKNAFATHYVDFKKTRKHDGYVYYWMLQDYLTELGGILSSKIYKQGDCKLFRAKYLSYVHHQQPMGRDIGDANNEKNPEWE